jgi:hypothetical protein
MSEEETRPPRRRANAAEPTTEVTVPEPSIEQQARGATEFKEDAVTVTPVPTLVKEEQTVGGRYYDLITDRINRRDAGLRYDVAVCNNCGHREQLEGGVAPRTQYKPCPVCGDTLRFTGVPVRDPNAEPLPAIADDELRSS